MSCICRTCLSEITSNHYVDINRSEMARKQLTLCIPELSLDLVIEPVLCMKCVEALNAAYDFKSCCLQTEQRIKAHVETLTIKQQNIQLHAVLGNYYNRINSTAMHCGDDVINDLNTVEDCARTRHDLEDYNDANGECYVKSENCSEMAFDDGVEVNYDNLKEEKIEIEEHELEFQDYSSSQKHDVDSKEQLKGLLQQYNKLDPLNYNANGENCNSTMISAESSTKQGKSLTKSEVGVVSMEPNNSCSSGTFSVAVMKGGETHVEKSSHLKCDVNIKSNNTAAIEAEADLHSVIDVSSLEHKHSNTSALNNSNTFTNVSLQCFVNSNNLSVQVKNQELSYSSQFLNTIGKKSYKCDKCAYACSEKSDLTNHLRTHTGEKPYKCDQCAYACSRKSDLSRHVRTHTGKKSYKCDQCDYACSIKSRIIMHIMNHTGEKPYKCNVCNYASSQKFVLDRHLRTHTGEKPFKCDQCDYACSHKSSLITHFINHTGEKPYKCNVCNYASSQKSNLSKHLSTHTGEKSYKCNVCNYASSQKSNLSKHLSTHTEEKSYKCDQCDFACSKTSLGRHMKKHAGGKPYKCDQCDYACSRKDRLIMHIMNHTGEKPYKCNVCNYATSQKSDLNKHLRAHTGEKPYKCDQCDFACSIKTSLGRHIMRKHTGEKPFKCNVCNYKCATNSNLIRHMRKHTGEKPYKCKVCNYASSEKSTLNGHLRTHLRKKIVNVIRPICSK